MPNYDLACGHEAIVPWTPSPECICPECGAETRRLPCAARTTGILPSNPLVLDNTTGKAINSNAEMRAWERDNPNVKIVAPNSKEWQDHVFRAKNLAERRANERGYRDFRHQAESWRDERKKKNEMGG